LVGLLRCQIHGQGLTSELVMWLELFKQKTFKKSSCGCYLALVSNHTSNLFSTIGLEFVREQADGMWFASVGGQTRKR
jgi:hypothetical protein